MALATALMKLLIELTPTNQESNRTQNAFSEDKLKNKPPNKYQAGLLHS